MYLIAVFLILIILVALIMITIRNSEISAVRKENGDIAGLLSQLNVKSAIVVIAHPDDETLGAFSLMASMVSQGIRVQVVLASDGNRRGLGNLRIEEFLSAMAKLEISYDNLFFLGYSDGKLFDSAERIEADLLKIMTERDPDLIVSHYIGDQHPDHHCVATIMQSIGLDRDNLVLSFPIYADMFKRLTKDDGWYHCDSQAKRPKRFALTSYLSQMMNPILSPLFLRAWYCSEIFHMTKNTTT
jgi:hypothetical protein